MQKINDDTGEELENICTKKFRDSLKNILIRRYNIVENDFALNLLLDEIEVLQDKYYLPQDLVKPGTMCWVTTKRTVRENEVSEGKKHNGLINVYLPIITHENIKKWIYHKNYDDDDAFVRHSNDREIETMARISRAAWEQGGMLSLTEVAALLNRSMDAVQRYLTEYRSQFPHDSLPLKGFKLKKDSNPIHFGVIFTMHEQGFDIDRIASVTKYTLDSIRQHLEVYNQLKDLFLKGYDVEDIGRITGLGIKSINHYLRIAVSYHTEIKERWKSTLKLPSHSSDRILN